MADPEQLEILKRGVETWNAWRMKHRKTRVNLRDANLSDINPIRPELRWSELSEGNLVKADLRDVDFSDVNLIKADLSWVDLSGAKLMRADLTGANLISTNLERADLTKADLGWANLSEASFRGADLTLANLLETVFGNTDLTSTKGLDSCTHHRPSTLDHRTLARSGELPLVFLRGVGLPDRLIEHLPSLLGEAIRFYPTFISYSTIDQGFAERLYNDLQGKGVRCWFAPEDMRGGKKTHEQLQQAINVNDKLLLILSEASIASQWVENEIRWARRREVDEKRRMLFPIRLVTFEALRKWRCFDADTGKDLATEIREYFIPDFSTWDHDQIAYQRGFEHLLRDLRADESIPPPA